MTVFNFRALSVATEESWHSGNRLCRRLAVIATIGLLAQSSSLPVYSGSLGRHIAVFVNDNHPDLPLKFFAAGKLGVIKPDWAQSYLVASYRYLTGNPLDQDEQRDILCLWHRRITNMARLSGAFCETLEDPCVYYFVLRNDTLGAAKLKSPYRYDFTFADSATDDSFVEARKNLQIMVSKFGQKSQPVKDWIAAQDCVFGVNKERRISVPNPARTDDSALAKQQRAYQIAAANFYLGKFEDSRRQFEAIAKEGEASWNELAWYMAARSSLSAAVAIGTEQQEREARRYIEEVMQKNPHSKYELDLIDLRQNLNFRINAPEESLKEINVAVLQPHSKRFGTNVGDLTSFLDEHSGTYQSDEGDTKKPASRPLPIEQYDLCDWLNTIQMINSAYLSDEEQKKLVPVVQEHARHALTMWRQNHTQQWLIAALSTNDINASGNQDLLRACNSVAPDSPAYLTAMFYSIDALIKSNKRSEAHANLAKLLSRADLPLSARNTFLTQKQMVCQLVPEYLACMTQSPVSICYSVDDIQFPEKWQADERMSTYYATPATLSEIHGSDLNSNLPQSFWVKWAKDTSVPAQLHKDLTRAAWVRSVILEQPAGLEPALASAFPSLKNEMHTYQNAPPGAEKQFALACLILKNCGMSPYVEPCNHHSSIADFNFYQGNYWTPAPATEKERLEYKPDRDDFFQPQEAWCNRNPNYGSDQVDEYLEKNNRPVLRELLTPAQLKALNAERGTMARNVPALLLSKPVVAWASSHPSDPRLPEMLYRVVKLPLWTGQSGIASEYSKQALNILHSRYPHSSYAKKIKWSY